MPEEDIMHVYMVLKRYVKQQERNEVSLYKYVALQTTQNLAENVTSKKQTFWISEIVRDCLLKSYKAIYCREL